jgi:hypothetical protein
MVIVAGHITVDPERRESYLAGSMSVVERARRADGCLDSAITADLLDPSRVNLFERSLSDPRRANTTVLSSDVAAAAGGLRAKPGRELQVHGSRTPRCDFAPRVGGAGHALIARVRAHALGAATEAQPGRMLVAKRARQDSNLRPSVP